MSKPDGGPAFPVRNPATNEQYSGMSLRQWYAGMALQGTLAAGPLSDEDGKYQVEDSIEFKVRHCYRLADAMIAEEENGKSSEKIREKQKTKAGRPW